jgi:hypothetical protein
MTVPAVFGSGARFGRGSALAAVGAGLLRCVPALRLLFSTHYWMLQCNISGANMSRALTEPQWIPVPRCGTPRITEAVARSPGGPPNPLTKPVALNTL